MGLDLLSASTPVGVKHVVLVPSGEMTRTRLDSGEWEFSIEPDDETALRIEAGLTRAQELIRSFGSESVMIVFSGGCILPGQPAPDSELMSRYANTLGSEVHQQVFQRIYEERMALDTFQNIEFSACFVRELTGEPYQKGKDSEPITWHIATDRLHFRRFKMSWEYFHLHDTLHKSPIPFQTKRTDVMTHILELCFLLVHFFDPGGNSKLVRKRRARIASGWKP